MGVAKQCRDLSAIREDQRRITAELEATIAQCDDGIPGPSGRTARQVAVDRLRFMQSILAVELATVATTRVRTSHVARLRAALQWAVPIRREAQVVVQPPPGQFLLACAEFLFSRKAFAEVVAPTISDLREEYNDALLAGRPRKATWVRIRGTWSFFMAAAALCGVSVGKLLTGIWKLLK